ncbi:dispanin subfamily A member 2b-like [Lepisosteus oculatus]|uniref:dispanin subfamily A member 2b-like n=1 Tax=Lepisosteus oculatus TaxID=7918 RepID=UPI00073FAF7E|nr:PREDICTED: dispanin subfamily A member 2b-like [Lepisosteus oculatus]
MTSTVATSKSEGTAQFPQTVVVEVGDNPNLIRDHIVWSICSFSMLNCCCLGLVALLNSVRARDQKLVRNLELARIFGNRARTFNIVSNVLSLLTIVIFLGIYAAAIGHVISSVKRT